MSKKLPISEAHRHERSSVLASDERLLPILNLRDEINRAFDDVFADFPWPILRTPFLQQGHLQNVRGPLRWAAPRITIVERSDRYELTVELLGLDEDDIEIWLSEGILTVRGEGKAKHVESGKDFHITARSCGAFCRSFRVPDDVDRDAIDVSIERDVLTISLPKIRAATDNGKPAKAG